jgi:hypothetical protein
MIVNDENAVLGSINNPIKCDGVIGEYEYLDNLATPDGYSIYYNRIGSINVHEGVILDIYLIEDDELNELAKIYFDMNHPNFKEERIVPGFEHINKFNQPFEDIDYLFERLAILDKEGSLNLPDKYVYIWTKAGMLLSKGAFIYALDDAFGLPIENMDVEALKINAAQIVHDLAGVHPKHPLIVANNKELEDLLLGSFNIGNDDHKIEEWKTTVKDLLIGLKKEERKLIILRFIKGYSSKEVGEIMGLLTPCVYLSRVLGKLRSKINSSKFFEYFDGWVLEDIDRFSDDD